MLFLLLVLLSLLVFTSSFVLGLGSYNRVIPKAHTATCSIQLAQGDADAYTPFGEDAPLESGDEDESDLDFNRRMAQEAYDDIRGVDTLVTYDKFMQWDDITEVITSHCMALHSTAWPFIALRTA
jgi:hypothetical protein